MKEVPVLIAGGGPVGMTLAKTLASFGIQCMLVERNPTTTKHPKMDITNSRTMEIFRRLGLSNALRDVAVPRANNFHVALITSLSGHELHRFRYPSVDDAMRAIRERNDGTQPVEPAMRVSQVMIEPVLKRAIEAEPRVDVRFGVEFEGLEQNPQGVVATVKGMDDGPSEQIKCQYLVGCDGGTSQVRSCLDIRYDGIPRVVQWFMIHFRSDSREILQRWGQVWHYRTGRASLIAQNDKDIWTLHTFAEPGTPLEQTDPQAVMDRFVGRPFPYETLVANRWNAHLLVAEAFSEGRVFLAGDASHQVIPTGGYGMATGIGDAFDLGWKLGATLKGYGGPKLLESYDRERRHVGLRNCQAAWRHMSVRAAIARVYDDIVHSDDDRGAASRAEAGAKLAALGNAENESYGIEMGYCYSESPIIAAKPQISPPDDPVRYEPTTLPGSRLPNVYLDDGVPLHDRLGPVFTLLTFGEASAEYMATAAERSKIPLEILNITDPRISRIYDGRLILVRPDQHISWRGNSFEHVNEAEAVLTRALGWGAAGRSRVPGMQRN